MIKAAIFDVDGILVDTEPFASKAYESIILTFGKKPKLQNSGLFQVSGMRESEVLTLIQEEYGITESIESLQKRRNQFYQDNLKKPKPMAGVIKLLRVLQKHKIQLAVASSSTNYRISMKLSLTKTKEFFEKIVSAEEVKRGKPYPDIFLETAKQLGIMPKNCLVFEDSQNGVISAHDAGMKVIAVPTIYTKKHDFSSADIVVKSLEDVTWKMLSKL